MTGRRFNGKYDRLQACLLQGYWHLPCFGSFIRGTFKITRCWLEYLASSFRFSLSRRDVLEQKRSRGWRSTPANDTFVRVFRGLPAFLHFPPRFSSFKLERNKLDKLYLDRFSIWFESIWFDLTLSIHPMCRNFVETSIWMNIRSIY